MQMQDPQIDWKEGLFRILSHEGITEPPHRAGFASVSVAFVKLATVFSLWVGGMILLMGVVGAIEIQVSPTRLAPYLAFAVWLGLTGRWIVPWLKRTVLGARGDVLGRRPTYLLLRARHPPVLYLRSFDLDKVFNATSIEPFESHAHEVELFARISRHTCLVSIVS